MLHRYRIIFYVSKRASNDTEPIRFAQWGPRCSACKFTECATGLLGRPKLFRFGGRRYAQKYAHSLHSSTIQACSARCRSE